MLTCTTSLPPPYIFLTPFTQRNAAGCRHLGTLSHPSSSSLPVFIFSVGVEGGGEDDVPADGQGGPLHLAPQDGVSHDAGGLSHLLQHLIQALDAADHRALLDIGEMGDFCEGLVTGVRQENRKRKGEIWNDVWWTEAEGEEGCAGQNSKFSSLHLQGSTSF